MINSNILILALVIGWLALLQGCGGDRAVNSSPNPVDTDPVDVFLAQPIEESNWIVTTLTSADGNRTPALFFPTYEMNFDDNAFGNFFFTFATCGGLEGERDFVDNNNVMVTSNVTTPAGDCGGVFSGNDGTDTFLKDVFTNTRTTLTVDGGRLHVVDTSGRSVDFVVQVATSEEEIDAELLSRQWRLESVENSNGEIAMEDRSFSNSPRFSLGFITTIDAAKKAHHYIGGKALCNAFMANYALESNALLISGMESNIERCDFSDDVIPTVFSDVLLTDASVIIEYDDELLNIISTDNKRLVFVPMPIYRR